MRNFMSWTFSKSTRMYDEIDNNGDKIYQLGVFDWAVDGTGTIRRHYNVGTATYAYLTVEGTRNITMENYHNNKLTALVNKYPNIRWFLCIRNDGFHSIFEKLYNNTDGAQDTFISEINRLLDENPWAVGIDIDLEKGGDMENRDSIIALFTRISNAVRARGKFIHYDLPGMTGPFTTVGEEKWCRYSDLEPIMDSCTIMSYGMAWAGSAPGPISPKDWLDKIYDYAKTEMTMSKVFLGLSGYGFRWQIYKPIQDKYEYRGVTSGTYMMFLYWMMGKYNHTETGSVSAGTYNPGAQPFIPFVGYWDDELKSAYTMMHVYDFQNVFDTISDKNALYPVVLSTYNKKPYATTYSQTQKSVWGDIVADVIANTSWTFNENGAITKGSTYLSPKTPSTTTNPPEVEGTATTTFNVGADGTYDIVLDVTFPWWDRAMLSIDIDGINYIAQAPSQWYPLHRTRHWIKLCNVTLTAGSHTFTMVGATSQKGSMLHGFRVATSYSFSMGGNSLNFKVKPATFKDVNGNMVQAATGYKLTLEALRRTPEYSLVWSDDWRSYLGNVGAMASYYTYTGSWDVVGEVGSPCNLQGSGEVKIKYDGFSDIRAKATFAFSGTEAGLILGNLKIALKSGQIVLYLNGSQVNNASADTTGTNSIIARCRGGSVDVYYNGSTVFTGITGVVSSTFGIYTNNATIDCSLIEAYDSYNMQLREAVSVTTPAGTQQLGRLNRNVGIDPVYNTVYIASGEEYYTRTDLDRYGEPLTISMDWDYLHTNEFSANGEFDVSIDFCDNGMWLGNLYLVDRDGASIGYYADMNHYFYWMNRAEFDYGCAGIGLWSLGQQDPNFYKYLP